MMTILKFLSLLLHLWSVIIAYHWYGLIGALLTLFFPVVAQVFWIVRLSIASDTVLSPYPVIGITFFLVFIITSLLKTATMDEMERFMIERGLHRRH